MVQELMALMWFHVPPYIHIYDKENIFHYIKPTDRLTLVCQIVLPNADQHIGKAWPKTAKSSRHKGRNTPADYPIDGNATLQWRHNGHDGVSNHQPHDYLLFRFLRHRSQKISKLRVTGLCEGGSPVTSEFPAQRASNAENISIWWRHHGTCYKGCPWQRDTLSVIMVATFLFSQIEVKILIYVLLRNTYI